MDLIIYRRVDRTLLCFWWPSAPVCAKKQRCVAITNYERLPKMAKKNVSRSYGDPTKYYQASGTKAAHTSPPKTNLNVAKCRCIYFSRSIWMDVKFHSMISAKTMKKLSTTKITMKAITLLLLLQPSWAQTRTTPRGGKGKGGGSGSGDYDLRSVGHHGFSIPCSDDWVEFESKVLVDIEECDDDPNDVTTIDFKGLELTFRDTYNGLSGHLCDDDFREVVWARIEPDENGDYQIRRGGGQYSLMFSVVARCRGCDPYSATLFSPPTDYYRRELGEGPRNGQGSGRWGSDSQPRMSYPNSKKDNKKGNSKKGKGNNNGLYRPKNNNNNNYRPPPVNNRPVTTRPDDYGVVPRPRPQQPQSQSQGFCECNTQNPEFRAPKEEEFRNFFDREVRKYGDIPMPHRHGAVDVDYILRVTEIEDVGCPDRVEEFQTMVLLELFGESTAVANRERRMLEDTFIQVYNGLQDLRCDYPYFRSITAAHIMMQADPGDPMTFIYVMKIRGTCRGRGCSENLYLFEDEDMYERRLGWDEYARQHPRDMACSCPVFDPEIGPPSLSDFEVRYFVAIQDLKEKGKIVNFQATGDVTELPFGLTPAPSMGPIPTEFPLPTFPPTPSGNFTGFPITPAPSSVVPTSTPAPSPPATDAPPVCTICEPGFNATNFDGIVSIPTQGDFTCLQLVDLAIPLAPDQCALLQDFTFEPCGCASDTLTGAPTPSAIGTAPPTTSPGGETLAPTPTLGVPTTVAPTTNRGLTEPPTPFGATLSPTASSRPSSVPTGLGDTAAPTIASNATSAPSASPSIGSGGTLAPSASPSIGSGGTLAPSASPSTGSGGTLAPSAAPSISSNATLAPSAAPSGDSNATLAPSAAPSGDSNATLAPSAAPSGNVTTVSPQPSSTPSTSPGPTVTAQVRVVHES